MVKGNFKTYVIDDSQYLMAFGKFWTRKEVGCGKFIDLATNFKRFNWFHY